MTEWINKVKFDEKGLVSTIVQDAATNAVLMNAYMNKESIELTEQTGYMHYFSRSRGKLWKKGETSGNVQKVVSLRLDCDGDAILARVEQTGPACHTGSYSCFSELVSGEDKNASAGIIEELYGVIMDRKLNPPEGSYTKYLFEKGIDKILKKVGEETAEVIIAAKNPGTDELRYESADLIYHLMVLFAEKGLTPQELFKELAGRR